MGRNPHTLEKYKTTYIHTQNVHSGKYDLSLQKFQEALDIRISALGPDHVDVSSTQYKMALVHEEKGHMQRALQLCNESLQKAAKVMGNDHPEVRIFM